MKDLFGQAIHDYYFNNYPENLITETSITEEDEMEVSYLFRTFENMPLLEQKAIELSKGKLLDIGCGAGSHSLVLQNKLELEVYAAPHSSDRNQTNLR
jgi:2-polyprenyl-3-methyl-5-hydroxy-6-metoxy-1,4-benzoquinol methylase